MMTEREFSDGCRRELAGRLGVRVESLAEKAARLDAVSPPSPALTLNMAAERLRRAAEAARAHEAEDGRTPDQWAHDIDNSLGGPVGVFCGLLSPELAEDLADWFDALAMAAVRQERAGGTQGAVTDGYPIRVAQRILGEAS